MSAQSFLYNNSPIFLQNAYCSLYGRKLYKQRYGSFYTEKLSFLRESQWWKKGEIDNYRSEQLLDLVNYVYHEVPYYNELFRALKLHPQDFNQLSDIQKIPVLTKEDVRVNWQKMRAPDYQRNVFLSHTSGSTGKALNFYQTSESIQFQWAVWWRFRERFNIHLGDKSLNFIGKLVVPMKQKAPPYWRFNKPHNQWIVNMQHIKAENAQSFANFIEEEGFDFFSGYPSIISALAEQLDSLGLAIERGPKIIMTGAETLYDYQIELMEKVFRCQVVDQYGFSEGAANASKCEKGLFHEDFEFGMIEDQGSEILTTGFANRAMPFIRYKVGDSATWTSKACDCGRESATIEKIEGRTEDYVLTPEGTKILRFDYLFKDMDQVAECQVIQRKKGEVVFAVVPRPGFSIKDEKVLKALVKEWISPTIEVEIETKSEIPRTATGKFKAVVSELN